ncbi:hypothetical protein PPTG_02498 [Phytophthora nicotianae INRA-310]|uniref:DUF7869 domain-containing protein n=2 Tax=Phytophthora nicotianae TaxID=4792 RepID=W2RBI5_PHYN3|nr:hypothetical protein PPTG_02498 [Phytophthora nicotianae INRA-310]ETN22611.1 hypothetical protein PPTG_02498 [Phytophthora nicotianae INRA-310]
MLRQLPPPPSPALESLTPEQPPSNDLASNGELPLTAMSSSLATEASPVVEIQLAQDTNEIEVASIQEPASVDESEEGESDEPDDSNDEDWSDVNGSTVEDEVLTGESETEEEEVDISIILENVDVHQIVVDLIRDDQCERRCLEGKAGEVEWLVASLNQMTKSERTTCILTLLGVLMQTDTAERRRGTGDREKFHYYLPFVGRVCRPSFASCLGVQPLTVQRYKRRVREGNIAAKAHGNKSNKNATKVDLAWLVKWFQAFAAEVGEVVPVRVRMQKQKDGMVKKYYSREDYTLLPATFTWDALYDEMHKFVESGLRVYKPARSTFRKLLSLHCPYIKIRSSQSNVCDVCSIYQTRMRQGATADKTEELGQHTESARRMRREYKQDKAASQEHDSDLAVIVMDFSQNLTIPSVTSTPSQWYFCSLLAVNVFGIFYENEGTQTNYVYDEFTSGKGSDQINSMLQHFIRTVLVPAGKKHLMVYADNCSGQNKNNHVIKFFLAQVQRGTFERVDYKFFVKGHTKNSCDRGFGHIRKHISRSDCWTMDHVISAVKDAAASNRTVHISRGNDFFKSYKPLLQELYKTLAGVQQYQIFSMIMEKPGVVLCKKGPDDAPVEKDLRRIVDGVLTENEKVVRMMDHFLEDLPVRPKNTEKIAEFYKNIRPYVPDEYQSDPLYAAPSKEQGEEAKSAKQARREHRAAMAVAAKANQDRRNRDAEEAVCPMPKRSRK